MTGFGAAIDAANYSQALGGFVAGCFTLVLAFFALTVWCDGYFKRIDVQVKRRRPR